jgi:Flp pilus assembly protein TadD
MKRVFLAATVLAGVALGGAAQAQNTGTARGKVVDDKGQGLTEVVVAIEYQGGMTRKFNAKTNKKGEYTQVGLQPGVYRFTASKEGYQGTFVETKINLGEPTYLPDIKLTPKAAAGAAAAGGAVDKGNAELKASFEKATSLMQAGKLDEAEAEYRTLAAAHPDVPQIHHNLAVLLTKKKDTAGAEAEYQKALEVRPDYTEGYAGLSNLYLTSGQGPKAVELLTKAVAARPQDASLQFQLGFAQFTTGQYEPAEAAFKAASTLDPANAEPYYYLGTIALTTGKTAECATNLEKYLSMKPTNAQNAATAPQLLQACKAK